MTNLRWLDSTERKSQSFDLNFLFNFPSISNKSTTNSFLPGTIDILSHFPDITLACASISSERQSRAVLSLISFCCLPPQAGWSWSYHLLKTPSSRITYFGPGHPAPAGADSCMIMRKLKTLFSKKKLFTFLLNFDDIYKRSVSYILSLTWRHNRATPCDLWSGWGKQEEQETGVIIGESRRQQEAATRQGAITGGPGGEMGGRPRRGEQFVRKIQTLHLNFKYFTFWNLFLSI